MDFLDLYDRGSSWTASKVKGAADQLDAQTPCEQWKVRDVVNHLLDTSRYFEETAAGKDASPPADTPPDVLRGGDPIAAHEKSRQSLLATYRQPGVIDKTGPSLAIAFCDQVLHGWDIAKGTGQDATIPDDLAEAAFGALNGRLTDENRGNGFKPEIKMPDTAPTRDKLLAYVGRKPS
jgi:uncharacterized protein (TIGR03086 family)